MENERKFLLKNENWENDVVGEPTDIKQYYLPKTQESRQTITLFGADSPHPTIRFSNETLQAVTNIPADVWEAFPQESKDRLNRNGDGTITIDDDLEIRVRVKNDKDALLTIKADSALPNTRHELEFPINASTAKALTESFATTQLHKIRYIAPCDNPSNTNWEIDIYQGENKGLETVEIELPLGQTDVKKPDWVDEDITPAKQYSNRKLAEHPLSQWGEVIKLGIPNKSGGHAKS